MPLDQQNPNNDTQQGVTLFTYLITSMTRSVQIFSRMPGTTGGNYFGLFFVAAFVMQLYYYQCNVKASMQFDAIHYGWFFAVNFGWLLVHSFGRWRAWSRGIRIHSYSPGEGILARWLPDWDPWPAALASDLATAAVMSGGFYLFGCPILGSWYRAMLFWLLIAHAFQHACDSVQMQRLDDAQIESEIWAERMRQREMQRQRRRNQH